VPTPSLALYRRYAGDCAGYAAAADKEQLDAATCGALRDAALDVRIRLMSDRIHQGALLAELGVPVEAMAARLAGHSDKPGPRRRLVDAARDARAQALDATARYRLYLRIALSELGARLTAAGTIASADDVFHLSAEEVLVRTATVTPVG
jgi:hypothetical protein